MMIALTTMRIEKKAVAQLSPLHLARLVFRITHWSQIISPNKAIHIFSSMLTIHKSDFLSCGNESLVSNTNHVLLFFAMYSAFLSFLLRNVTKIL